MSIRQTLDFLLDEAKRRGAVPIAFLLEPDAFDQWEREAAPYMVVRDPACTDRRYRGYPIEHQGPGKGITIRTIV